MNTLGVLLCFVVIWYQPILPISFRVTSLVMGQSYNCPNASEANLKNIDKFITQIHKNWYSNYNKIKHNQACSYLMGSTGFVLWIDGVRLGAVRFSGDLCSDGSTWKRHMKDKQIFVTYKWYKKSCIFIWSIAHQNLNIINYKLKLEQQVI